MKFEELEAIWAAQQPANPPAADLAEMKRQFMPELRRRKRMLGYELSVNLFGLLIFPLLTVANYRYDPLHYGTAWSWTNAACQWAVIILWVTFSFRRMQRHRALLRQSAKTLREIAAVSLANIEAEMNDYRLSSLSWLALGSAIVLASTLANRTILYGWKSFGLPASLLTMGLFLVVGLTCWRHYHVNLKPAHARQKEILQQLS